MRAPLIRMTLTALAVLAADQLSKWAVVEAMALKTRLSIEVLPPLLQFRMAWNQGINFGLFDSDTDAMRWGLTGLALVVSAALVVWAARAGGRVVPLATGLIIGGAIGNAWDRISYGAVADFLNVSCCGIDNPYSFNIADAAIFLGAAALVLMPAADAPPADKA